MALTKPFAENGDKKAIPENTTGDGSLSYETGFGGFYALPPEEGGLFIDRAQFNQLMYDTTSQVLENKQALSNLSGSTYNKAEIGNMLGVKANRDELKTKANANDTVNLTGNQTIYGVKTFNDNIVSPNVATMQNSINTINTKVGNLEAFVNPLAQSGAIPVCAYNNLGVKTVGVGGDFSDIYQALIYANTHKHNYPALLHIKLINDTGLDEIHLQANNVVIDCNGFTLANWVRFDNSNLRIINLKLGTGAAIFANTLVVLTGTINLTYTKESYAQGAITGFANSQVWLSLEQDQDSTIETISSRNGIFAYGNSSVYVSAGKYVQNSGASFMGVFNGGLISFNLLTATYNGSVPITSQAENTLTSAGIIFK